MGSELQSRSGGVKTAENDVAALNSELEFQLAQTAVDIAGVADPTPISDVVGAGMSIYSGDVIGAGLSLISVVPYAGDALGKTAKGARVAKKIKNLKKSIEAAIASTNLAKKLARRSAAAAVRAKRKAEAARKAVEAAKSTKCKPPSNPFGVRNLPSSKGTWKGTRGNGDWIPDVKTQSGREILEATGGKPITFKDGYPDFSPYSTKRVEIDMKGTNADFTAANKAAGYKETPAGMTWHHNEDGVTMELIPTKINNNVPHDGGASIVGDGGF